MRGVYLYGMKTKNLLFLNVWLSLVLASVVACSDSSSSGTDPEFPEPGSDVPGDSLVIGDDNQPIPGLSSAIVDDSQNPQAGLSSSSKKDDSHEGPLPGEDPGMVAVDTTVPFVGNFPVIFSEVSPSNANFKDNDGNDPGWLELYNTSDAPVSLKGVALSNDVKYPRRWVFGNATIPAKSHMIVFLSGKNYADYIPPSDSVNMIGSDCSSEASAGGFGAFPGMGDWGGGMGDFGGGFGGGVGGGAGAGGVAATGNTGNAENLPGQSSLCFNEGGVNQVGAVMKVAQGGTYTRVVVNSGSAKLGNADQLVIRGFITKTHKIRVNFKEGNDISAWTGKNLRGTGDSSTVYYVRLGDNAADIKRSNVTATTFATETQGSESTTIKVSSYIARKRGHEPHTTFKAEDQGGALYLVSETGVLDSVRYSAVPTGASWSRDAAGKWGFATPSPYGNTVGEVFAVQAQTNEVNIPASGFYSSPVSVTFPAGTRCEQGGTAPTENSPVVEQTLNISATTVLRCRVFAAGSYPSEEVIRTYVFETQPSIATLFVTTDPLSMFSPDTGLYMTGNGAAMMDPKKGANFWSNRELPVYVELFEPNKPQTPAFGIMGDYKISGQYSRAKEKKSFSITLREEYGDKRLKYSLFPDYPELKKFKAFSLRNFGNNCGNDYVRDRIGTQMTEGLGVDYQHGRYVVVFYNGKYYGLHDLRERNNEYFYETRYGLDPNDIDLIDATNEASTGSATDYLAMLDWLQSNELTSDANYQKIADQIDVDNYMNYMQAEMFLNNGDWPHNNMKKWRVASQKSKWKWFLYDVDFGFDVSYNTQNSNVFSYVTNRNGTNGMGMMPGMGGGQQSGGSISEHTILMIRLLENENFKKAFINRFCVLLAMNFSADRLVKQIDDLQSQVQGEMNRDIEFWGFDASSYSSNLERIKSFAQSRQQTIMSEMQQYFSLGESAAVTLSSQGSGKILVHNLALDQSSMAVNFFRDVPVTVTAEANAGAVFSGWSDGVQEATRTFNPGEVTTITATFK